MILHKVLFDASLTVWPSRWSVCRVCSSLCDCAPTGHRPYVLLINRLNMLNLDSCLLIYLHNKVHGTNIVDKVNILLYFDNMLLENIGFKSIWYWYNNT